ncbi:MAG TPA: gliding motility-associated C-terminal domain-containing protein, partial [Ferruginibacter sp.]|nr:gliding motility-associated C-terminal domain-containing protein [Ferruginibacter sp.]
SVCAGTTNTYSIAPVTGALNYTWSLPSGWSGISNTPSITVNVGNNSGTIKVLATNICGPTYQSSLDVTVSPVLTANVGLFANPAGTICPGTLVTFTAQNIGTAPATNYDFKINGVSKQSGLSTVYITSSLVNGDAVTCTVTVSGTCLTASSAVSNTITASVANSTPAVSISASIPGPVCQGTPVQFVATPYNLSGSTVINYDFKINGGIEQSGSSNIFNWTSPYGDDASVTIRVIGGMCLTTNTATSPVIPFVVDAIPVISFNPPDQSITLGSSTTLNPNLSVSGGSYLWTPSTGLNDPTLLNPIASPIQNTTYNLHVITAGGCTADKQTTIKVYKDIFIPNAFMPEANAVNRIFRIPPGTSLQLDYFRIFDRWGNKIFTTSNVNEGWDGTFKGKPCPPGTYVYTIKGTDFRGEVVRNGTVLLLR